MFWNDMYVIVGMVSVQFKSIFKKSLYLSQFFKAGWTLFGKSPSSKLLRSLVRMHFKGDMHVNILYLYVMNIE